MMKDLGNHAGQAGRSVMDHATEAEEASPRAMQAYVVRQDGGPEVLREETVAVPEIRPGWSLIRVRAFGINHSEIFTRQGLSPSVRFPRILGIDCAGEIMETTDPDRLPVGRAVGRDGPHLRRLLRAVCARAERVDLHGRRAGWRAR